MKLVDITTFILGAIVGAIFSFIASIAANLLTPRVSTRLAARSDRAKTKTITSLEARDTEVTSLHSDFARLSQFGFLQLTGVMSDVVLAFLILLLAWVISSARELWVQYPSVLYTTFVGLQFGAYGGAAALLILTIQKITDGFAVVRNVYYFDEWTQFVSKRRAELEARRSPD